MPCAKGVIRAFGALREPRNAARLPERRHRFAPPCEDLMSVSLMPHIPDDRIIRGIEDIVKRHGKLHRAETRRQVTARLRD